MRRVATYVLISIVGLLAGFAVLYRVTRPKPGPTALQRIRSINAAVCECLGPGCGDRAWDAFVRTTSTFGEIDDDDRPEADRLLHQIDACRRRGRTFGQ